MTTFQIHPRKAAPITSPPFQTSFPPQSLYPGSRRVVFLPTSSTSRIPSWSMEPEHSRGALCLRGECPEPILRILDSPSGSGFGGDGRLHALLRQLLFWSTPLHTES